MQKNWKEDYPPKNQKKPHNGGTEKDSKTSDSGAEGWKGTQVTEKGKKRGGVNTF